MTSSLNEIIEQMKIDGKAVPLRAGKAVSVLSCSPWQPNFIPARPLSETEKRRWRAARIVSFLSHHPNGSTKSTIRREAGLPDYRSLQWLVHIGLVATSKVRSGLRQYDGYRLAIESEPLSFLEAKARVKQNERERVSKGL
jgi:hypothetical protein